MKNFMLLAVYCDPPPPPPTSSNISYRRILPPGKEILAEWVTLIRTASAYDICLYWQAKC
jgi:hypothetical protein